MNGIGAEDVLVVSGGARGITARCVIRMAGLYRCGFILIGRSRGDLPEPDWARGNLDEAALKRASMESIRNSGGKPTPAEVDKKVREIQAKREIEATLKAVKSAGGKAQYLSMDITSRTALEKKLKEAINAMGSVTGVIHGAGNLADKLIEKKTLADFESVYGAKVRGLENILGCLKPEKLKFIVLFSSIAAFYGNRGQADYAIANEILNKSAHLLSRKLPSTRVLAINWGPWDGGMVTPELKKILEEHQIELIPMESGPELLTDELADRNKDSIQVLFGDAPPMSAAKINGSLLKYRIRRTVKPENNPFLNDHLIGGKPVLPFACAASWLAQSCERLYRGFKFFSLESFTMLKGIIFDSSNHTEFVLDLREIEKSTEKGIFAEGTIRNGRGGKHCHYRGQVRLLPRLPAAPVYQSLDLGLSADISGVSLYREKKLFHGPVFQGVERILNISPDKITIQCSLPEVAQAVQGQFPAGTVNPYTGELLLQTVLAWAHCVHQSGCLPVGFEKFEQFISIPFGAEFYVSMEVREKKERTVCVNIFAHDANGRIYMRFLGVSGIISKSLERVLTGHHQSGAA